MAPCAILIIPKMKLLVNGNEVGMRFGAIRGHHFSMAIVTSVDDNEKPLIGERERIPVLHLNYGTEETVSPRPRGSMD